ncbi:MAG: hypothetical protein LBF83_08560 [Spirochaetaceae bacterium]|jgi:hypothetical protein|nr:hypothetical protein [Spirochaetaceae bacterium]
MSENDFLTRLKEVLEARRDWFDRVELPKLKNDFYCFHNAVTSLYALFAKKGFIIEDPYKNETKAGDLEVPAVVGTLSDSNKRELLGRQLSALDNELDFLVNFYEFSTSSFTQEKLKIMVGLVKYVDWMHLTPDGINPATQAVSEIVTKIRHGINDQFSTQVLTDSLVTLTSSTKTIINSLKLLSDFNRELYKYDLRVNITSSMSADEATALNIKKKLDSAKNGIPFHTELVNELIKEDYSANSKSLREAVLQKLSVEMGQDRMGKNGQASFKPILIDGLNCIGSAGVNIGEIVKKISENSYLLERQKKGIWEKIKKLIAQISNSKEEPVIYELEQIDTANGRPVCEKLNFNIFCATLDKKMAILNAIALRGTAVKKLEGMNEEHLIELLQRNMKDVLNLHKTLNGLDDYFKNAADKDTRPKIKGIKPELSALKNTITKANEKLQDYNAQKEEAEQFKKLGINMET